jgi:hypothetical protein
MANADWDDELLRQRAERLLETLGMAPILSLTAPPWRRSNRVYRLETTSRSLLLKAYFRHPLDLRDRLAAEAALLALAWTHGVRSVPEPIAFDHIHAIGLQEFVPDASFVVKKSTAQVEQAASFLVDLNRLRDTREATQLPIASEACFSFDEHLAKVEQRVQRIESATWAADDVDLSVRNIRSRLRSLWDRVHGESSVKPAARTSRCTCRCPPKTGACRPPISVFTTRSRRRLANCGSLISNTRAGMIRPRPSAISSANRRSRYPASSLIALRSLYRQCLPIRLARWLAARLLWPVCQVRWCCILLNGCS